PSNFRLALLALVGLTTSAAVRDEEPTRDCYGDPLPAGAIARLGTVRWRNGDGTSLLSFLPDGKVLLSAGWDESVRQWDGAGGKEPRGFKLCRRLGGEAGGPIVVSADCKVRALSGGTAIHLWDVATGKEMQKVSVAGGRTVDIALTADGTTL